MTLLREELASQRRADAEPALALLPRRLSYTAELRQDLARGEALLAEVEACHRRLLDDLWAPSGIDTDASA